MLSKSSPLTILVNMRRTKISCGRSAANLLLIFGSAADSDAMESAAGLLESAEKLHLADSPEVRQKSVWINSDARQTRVCPFNSHKKDAIGSEFGVDGFKENEMIIPAY